MTIVCTEEQKKEIIHSQFCPVSKCQLYSREHGAKYETCEQCREENIEWIIERPQGITEEEKKIKDLIEKYDCGLIDSTECISKCHLILIDKANSTK